MKHLRLTILALAAVGLLAAGVGSALAATPSTNTGAKVGVARTALGSILVDARGRTLYLFEKDARGKSSCVGQCATFWPPLITSGRPIAIAGARASLLGTTKRADGRLQVTYNHHPLYTFVKDAKKGWTKGEGVEAFGAEWYALSSAGVKVEKATASTNGQQGTGGYGSGGYGSGGSGY